MKNFILTVTAFTFLVPSFSHAYKCEVRKWLDGTKRNHLERGDEA